jgi:methionyl-tRNA formyltransferase
MGTPEFAVPCLQSLLLGPHEVVAVYTQQDRPQGRGLRLQPPPVKRVAEEAGIAVYQPDKMTSEEARERLCADRPDLVVVTAYGKILRPHILMIPPLGCINCHASLLPAYRGSAPIYWALARGERQTGVTTMLMNSGMDTGPMLKHRAIEIGPDETVGSLHDRLAQLSAELLDETIAEMVAGSLSIEPQDEQYATYAPMLTSDDNWIDLARPCREVHNHIRALDPFPGARIMGQDGTQLKLFGSSLRPDLCGTSGEVLSIEGETVTIACASGAVAIREIQAPGRKRMSVSAFLKGNEIPLHTIFKKAVS